MIAWIGPSLVVAAGIIAYHNSAQGEFLYDDIPQIVNNPRIHSLSPLNNVLSGRRPVSDLTLAMNYHIHQLDVRGYHVVNLVIHLLAGLTLYGLVRRTLCACNAGKTDSDASILALIVAVLWVVHPLQTQSVTYIIQRSESLMGLFYLLTLYCVLRGSQSTRSVGWHIAAVAACTLGMGSKAVMVTAPMVTLLFDRAFITPTYREIIRQRALLYTGLAATWSILLFCGVLQGVLDPSRTSANVGFGFKDISPYQYALTQSGVIFEYLKLSIWPLSLCIDYNLEPVTSIRQTVVPSIIILLFLAATLWVLIRKPAVGFLGAGFFLILSPTSSFIPIKDLMFEHRMYLPLASIITLILLIVRSFCGWITIRFSLDHRDVLLASGTFLIAITIILITLTIQRNGDYHDDITMWRDVAMKRPNNPRPLLAIGSNLIQQRRFTQALVASRKAIRLDVNNAEAHSNAGLALASMNRFRDAMTEYKAAIRINPDHFPAYTNLGIAQAQQGQLDEALKSFRQAIRIEPRDPAARHNLGFALSALDRLDEALEEFEFTVTLDPLNPNGHYQLGLFYYKIGRTTEAVSEFQRTLQINPDHPEVQPVLKSALNDL